MNRRTFEGHMDWEYQNNRGPLDMSSPFSQVPQRPFANSSTFGSPSVSKANPFAALGKNNTPGLSQAPPSPSKQQFPRPPSSSLFSAPAAKTFPSASAFRNPAFTTPQRRSEEVVSECSGAEESPAVASEASEDFGDTPDYGQYDNNMTITLASAVNRKLFTDQKTMQPESSQNLPSSPISGRTPGRGEVPRGKMDLLFTRRGVRKRRRRGGDNDVGSVRSRFHVTSVSDYETDDTDVSDWGESKSHRRSERSKRRGQQGDEGGGNKRSVVGNLFSAIHDHPNVPLILSWWVQLAINVFLVSVFIWFVWSGIRMMQADIAHAADAERSRLLTEMNACANEYLVHRCEPKTQRLPALRVMCDEWEVCMNQDPASVMKMQVSAKNVAEIINEFVGAMSIKAWGFIISAMLAMVLASNLGFSRFRETAFLNHNQANGAAVSHQPFPSQPAVPMLASPQDPNQAYIWAPIGQTPRHIRREFLLQADTPTDTDGSPDGVPAAIMAPPQTPSFRRSPTKGERSHSPSKTGGRTGGKAY